MCLRATTCNPRLFFRSDVQSNTQRLTAQKPMHQTVTAHCRAGCDAINSLLVTVSKLNQTFGSTPLQAAQICQASTLVDCGLLQKLNILHLKKQFRTRGMEAGPSFFTVMATGQLESGEVIGIIYSASAITQLHYGSCSRATVPCRLHEPWRINLDPHAALTSATDPRL